MFQSTHPCGVRLGIALSVLFRFQFQSTHPCGVRPHNVGDNLAALLVSIHAPVWGATNQDNSQDFTITVSIHAPVWGATRDLWHNL